MQSFTKISKIEEYRQIFELFAHRLETDWAHQNIEYFLYHYFSGDEVNLINNLGVSGNIAFSGEFVDI